MSATISLIYKTDQDKADYHRSLAGPLLRICDTLLSPPKTEEFPTKEAIQSTLKKPRPLHEHRPQHRPAVPSMANESETFHKPKAVMMTRRWTRDMFDEN